MSEARNAPEHVDHLSAVQPCSTLYTAFAVLRQLREGRTRRQETFWEVELGDGSAALRGKVWPDATAAMEAVPNLVRGQAVKALFHAELFQGRLQLNVKNLRAAGDGETGYDAEALFGAGYQRVRDLMCAELVFDIETVPAVDRRRLPPTIAESLARWAERAESEEGKVMSLSPFFGSVVSLAVGDAAAPPDQERIAAFVVPPGDVVLHDPPPWMRPVSEPELLQAFWSLASGAETVISFNGRAFDVPFLVSRSLVHGIPARVDLLSNRYSLRPHLDLYRALTNGERSLGPANLDVLCWALGIQSPKGQMDGSMVASAYERGDIARIAEYNAHDVRATTAVYHALRDRVLRFRDDW